MKINYLLSICFLTLLGCNPFNERQSAVQQSMIQSEKKAQSINKKYQPTIREIKPYKVYRYNSKLEDPFRARAFVIQEIDDPETVADGGGPKNDNERCIAPKCVPPEPHPKELLENYNLSALSFVGTLANDKSVGLINTPDFGVVPIKVGNYLGKNNGKILIIKESALILQEKIKKSGIWEDKKTILVIKR